MGFFGHVQRKQIVQNSTVFVEIFTLFLAILKK